MNKANKQLGKFRIIRKIGKGAMASVYLAEDPQLGRTVAVKVLPPKMAQGEDWVARFNREVRATANLFHPNIVTVYDVGQQNNIHYYAMEYLPNGDLKQRIAQGISIHEALIYLKQIAKALRYAHNKGFIHRDVKPDNILFDEGGSAKLTDLGIAKALNQTTRVTDAGVSIGTPRYISPEQAQGESLDGRSDIYSLGVVFYEMLTGEVPYDSDDPLSTALAHINDEIPQLPPPLAYYQEFLEAMMAKDRADRFTSADDVIEAIEKLENDEPFTLDDYYQHRNDSQDDVLHFENIYDSNQSRPKIRFWLVSLFMVSLLALGYYQKNWVIDTFDNTYQQALSLFVSNTADEDGPRGVIQIDSEPTGATVYLNDVKMGQTPYLGQSIIAGEHQLKLTHPLFSDLTARIQVQKDTIVKKQFTLTAGYGDLQVKTTPAGATIVLNGTKLSATTPYYFKQVKSGTQQLFLFKDHLAAKLEVDVMQGKEQTIAVDLKPGYMAFYPDVWVPIDQLYKTAEQLTKTSHWSTPTGYNAEEAYRAILKADVSHSKAKQQLFELGKLHWQAASQAAENGDLNLTEQHLNHSRRLLKNEYSRTAAQKLIRQARR